MRKRGKEKISIIIAAYRASNTIGYLLDAFKKQDYPDFEVIIVDDAPFEPCKKAVMKHRGKNVTYSPNAQNIGLSRSFNKGLKIAKGSIVVMLHDDCVPIDNSWLSNLAIALAQKDVAVASSEVVFDFDKLSTMNKIFSYIYGLGKDKKLAKDKGTKEVSHIGSRGDAFRKEFLTAIKGYDETFKAANEDTDISFRITKMGKKILLVHDAKIEHIFSQTERQADFKTHMIKALQLTRQSIHTFVRYGVNYKLDMALAIVFFALSLFISRFGLLAATIPTFFMSRAFFAYSLITTAGLALLQLPLWISPVSYTILKNIAKSVRYMVQQKSIALALPIFVIGIAWDIMAGFGWLGGTLRYAKQKILKLFA